VEAGRVRGLARGPPVHAICSVPHNSMPPLIGAAALVVSATEEDVVDMMLGVRGGGLGNCSIGVGEVGTVT
jgi:hypothetical protein